MGVVYNTKINEAQYAVDAAAPALTATKNAPEAAATQNSPSSETPLLCHQFV